MAVQRYISTSFWTDKWIRKLDPSERYLYLYLITNPQTNIAGVYQITLDRIAFDTGYDERTLGPMLKRFESAKKAYFYAEEWLILPSFPKHQKWEIRPTIKAGINAILKDVPKKVQSYMVSIGYQYPIVGYEYPPSYSDIDLDSDIDSDLDSDFVIGQQPQQQSAEDHEHYEHYEQESELHEQPTQKPVKTQRFSKPTLEEVSAYCQERSNRIDARQFLDYYEANGWKVGRNPMRNWRAAVRTWERHETSVMTTRASTNVLSFEERAKKQREENTAEVLRMLEEGKL